ncbi:MAG: flavodoxin family protein [Syntrophales bacterium]|nr:flavodoxin family protein [Syntrophales bacterium]
MKALVTYYSQTGNTEKLARAIYDAIHFDKELLRIQDVKSSKGYDIIFVGFPVQAHSVPAAVHPFFKNLPDKQPIALFCTHGSIRGGHLPKQAIEHAIGLASRAKVLGTFGVRGKVNPKVIDALMTTLQHQAWAEEAQGAIDHPTDADLADGKTFAKGILAKQTWVKEAQGAVDHPTDADLADGKAFAKSILNKIGH